MVKFPTSPDWFFCTTVQKLKHGNYVFLLKCCFASEHTKHILLKEVDFVKNRLLVGCGPQAS